LACQHIKRYQPHNGLLSEYVTILSKLRKDWNTYFPNITQKHSWNKYEVQEGLILHFSYIKLNDLKATVSQLHLEILQILAYTSQDGLTYNEIKDLLPQKFLDGTIAYLSTLGLTQQIQCILFGEDRGLKMNPIFCPLFHATMQAEGKEEGIIHKLMTKLKSCISDEKFEIVTRNLPWIWNHVKKYKTLLVTFGQVMIDGINAIWERKNQNIYNLAQDCVAVYKEMGSIEVAQILEMSLISCLEDLERYEEAMQRCKELEKVVSSSDLLENISTQKVVLLMLLGKLEEAWVAFETCKQNRRQNNSSDIVLDSILSGLYYDEKRFAEYCTHIIELIQKSENHTEMTDSAKISLKCNLACGLRELGRFQEAKIQFKTTLEESIRHLGMESRITCHILLCLAPVLIELGEKELALEILKYLKQVYEKDVVTIISVESEVMTMINRLVDLAAT
jgi:tetratricopeptide (TPR) repeat protein